jgi:hypothetical protein
VLERERAILEAALKLTEEPLKMQTAQALKRSGSRFFLDVVVGVGVTPPKVTGFAIGRGVSEEKQKKVEVVSIPGIGERVTTLTTTTVRAKTAVAISVDRPKVDVEVVDAKINWLTPARLTPARLTPASHKKQRQMSGPSA